MKKNNQKGTALLIAVFVTTILLTGMLMLWRTVALSYEGAMWHYRAKRQFYSNESLVYYGLALIKSKLVPSKQLSAEKFTLIYKGHWPKSVQTWGELSASYDRKHRQFNLRAQLFGNDHCQPLATTYVTCQKAGKIIRVLTWKYES